MIRRFFVDCVIVAALCAVVWGSAPLAVAQLNSFCCGLNDGVCKATANINPITRECLATPSCNSLGFSCKCKTTGTLPAGGLTCSCKPLSQSAVKTL